MHAPPTCVAGLRRSWCPTVPTVSAMLMLLIASWGSAASAGCTSGVLQIKPVVEGVLSSQCMSADTDRNSIKAICGAAFKVTVDKNRIIRLVPLETGSLNVSLDSGFGSFGDEVFDCKNHNASGMLNAGSTTAATVMLYDDLDGKLSNLTRTGSNQLALAVAHSYNGRGDPTLYCTFNYTVTSGCVLGAQAAAPSASCSPGYISKEGRFGLKYCSPCPKGTYSPGGAGATACLPCPIGTTSTIRGAASCNACMLLGGTTPQEGSTQCDYSCGPIGGATVWSNGTQCGTCPAGSVASRSNVAQCVKCYAGKKCCTLNSDTSCPECDAASAQGVPPTYTSTFALESANPGSCLDSGWLCAPKISITIDGTCGIQIESSPGSDCLRMGPLPIQGATINTLRDLSSLGETRITLLPTHLGNVTAAASPYLDITDPTGKCTFRYRALTKPAAELLGVSPKPGPGAACPTGTYRDTTTDTAPGPCLPCSPGTHSIKAGVCTPCPTGTYSVKYSSRSCAPCPADTTSPAGSSACGVVCPIMTYPSTDRSACVPCPKNTQKWSPGAGMCLGNTWGSICCGAGECSKQVACGPKFTPPKGMPPQIQSIFRLKSSSLSAATCKNATFISCLKVGDKMLVSMLTGNLQVEMSPPGTATGCTGFGRRGPYYGSVVAPNRAVVRRGEPTNVPTLVDTNIVHYEVLSSAAANTITMYLSSQTQDNSVPPTPTPIKECSATFELLHGFFLDLKPPVISKCPTAANATKVNGRILCRFCGWGQVRKASGACQACPKGTYQPEFDGNTCKPCPAGYRCAAGSSSPIPCNLGHYSPKAGLASCLRCKAGTYSGGGEGFKACFKCPLGTIAPPASRACRVPFATTFE